MVLTDYLWRLSMEKRKELEKLIKLMDNSVMLLQKYPLSQDTWNPI